MYIHTSTLNTTTHNGLLSTFHPQNFASIATRDVYNYPIFSNIANSYNNAIFTDFYVHINT